jgi:ribose/xylose/arabinose/galactoside ABC-type transport system permease subunit
MKRYLIFGIIGPFIGGFILLFVTTYQSGYWEQTSLAEVQKLFIVFIKTLQYSYLFGIVPSLMIGAIDDILYHVRRISPLVRTLMVGVVAFAAATLLYSSRGPDSGTVQFFLYGLVGLVPGMLSSWLSHRYADEPKPAVKA